MFLLSSQGSQKNPSLYVCMCEAYEAPCYFFGGAQRVSSLNRMWQLSENHGDRKVFLELRAAPKTNNSKSNFAKYLRNIAHAIGMPLDVHQDNN